MARTYQIEISGAVGYDAEQCNAMTVGDLRELLAMYDDDDKLVLHDESNRYGASFGNLLSEINVSEMDGDE